MAYAENLAFGRMAPRKPDMSIETLLQERVFDPEMVTVMTDAYDRARCALGLSRRTDKVTAVLAQTVISIVERGIRDPDRIYELTLASLKYNNGLAD